MCTNEENQMADISVTELMQMQAGFTDQEKLIFTSQYSSDKKDRTIAIILSVIIGMLGVDRFYVGDTGLGIIKLLTAGGCFIWYLVDWFLIMGRADTVNRAKAQEIAVSIRASSTG